MKIVKRDGQEVEFNKLKIEDSIKKANANIKMQDQATSLQITIISTFIEVTCNAMPHTPTVEEVQDMVEDMLIQFNRVRLFKSYAKYSCKKELAGKSKKLQE